MKTRTRPLHVGTKIKIFETLINLQKNSKSVHKNAQFRKLSHQLKFADWSPALVFNMYSRSSIQKILNGDTKILVTVLKIVTTARKTLNDIRKICISSRKTMNVQHSILLNIRKILQRIHKISDIPNVVIEALKNIRDTTDRIQRLLSNIRDTKKFIVKVVAWTFKPLESQEKVIIAPCHKRVKE